MDTGSERSFTLEELEREYAPVATKVRDLRSYL